MRLKSRTLILLSLFLACLLSFASGVYAQGGATSTLVGTVVDSSGGVVPGADVTAKDNATGTTFTAVSGASGSFTIPAIPSATYTVTVSLMGFKSAVLNNVTTTVGNTTSIKAVLELGKLEETVVVEAAAQMVQTQQTSVSSTINVKQITNLPLPGRDAFTFVTQMPGVSGSDGSSRGSTVNGLPSSTVNITLDGMNIQDNYAKSWDGMFTRVSPRIDAVEEMQIGSAAQGADASQGAVQVRFVTRSGTNKWQGSAYYYLRSDALNTNTWWNLHYNVSTAGVPAAKAVTKQIQPGARLGGPIIKDKAFFFINYEYASSPGTYTLNNVIMSPSSEAGTFLYGTSGSVNLLTLAASKGYTSTIDPLIAKTLAAIRSSTATTGQINATTDPSTQAYSWQQPTTSVTKYPTVRVDYNLTSKHKLTGSFTQNHLLSDPDTTNGYWLRFPGFPIHGSQDSARYSGQGSMRSILTPNLVNEVRFGATGGATKFFPELNASMFDSFGGLGLGITAFKSITNPYATASNSSREGSTKVIEDTVNWMKGKHSINLGVNYTRADVWYDQQQYVPTINFGVVTGDPTASGFFNTTNFPGASTTDLTNATNLYAVLTGRVSGITRNARIAPDGSTYVILGPSHQVGRMNEFGFYLQDSWRVRPSLTVNAGLRYELQLPFYALNNSYSTATMADIMGVTGLGTGFAPGSTVTGTGNLFQPGVLQGTAPTYKLLTSDTHAYNIDKNNLAPNIGVAWTVGSDKGMLHTLFGKQGDSVIRGGYSRTYQRPGMSDFTTPFGANPGISIDASRNLTNGNLGTPPILLSTGDLSAPATNLTRVYPMAVPTASSNVYAFDPNIQVPSSQSFTFGMQRAIGKTMMAEARFVHTSSKGQWTESSNWGYLNYNEINVYTTGFMDEFRTAQANLQANIAAGRGNTFAYKGAGTGTSPLPILLAYLNGSAVSTDSTKYTGTNWTNTGLVTDLYPLNPLPLTMASSLVTTASYKANALTAGLPANFFVANPNVTAADVITNGPGTHYNALQLSLRRRFSQGLQADVNYTYGRGYQTFFYSFTKPYVELEQNYTNMYTNSGTNQTGGTRHTLTANWVYELPFGQGKPFAGNVGRVMQRVIGNWSFTGTARIQSGRMVDFGNVRLVGFTQDQLPGLFQTRMVTDPANPYRTLVYMLPQDIIDNTIKAFSVNATGYSAGAPTGRYFAPANSPTCLESVSGYGDCGARSVIVTGPKSVHFDMSLVKEVQVTHTVTFRFEAMVFNVFNNLNLTPNAYTGSTSDSYKITGSTDSSRTAQLAFRITF
jgi:hypothetical protein